MKIRKDRIIVDERWTNISALATRELYTYKVAGLNMGHYDVIFLIDKELVKDEDELKFPLLHIIGEWQRIDDIYFVRLAKADYNTYAIPPSFPCWEGDRVYLEGAFMIHWTELKYNKNSNYNIQLLKKDKDYIYVNRNCNWVVLTLPTSYYPILKWAHAEDGEALKTSYILYM